MAALGAIQPAAPPPGIWGKEILNKVEHEAAAEAGISSRLKPVRRRKSGPLYGLADAIGA